MEVLANEVRRSRRPRPLCALLMADVDHIQGITTTLRHWRATSAQAHRGRPAGPTRNVDAWRDTSGEEFVVLMPETQGQAGAIEMAQRIPSRLAPTSGWAGSSAQNRRGPVPRRRRCTRGAARRADAALYRAKARGQDACCGRLHPKATGSVPRLPPNSGTSTRRGTVVAVTHPLGRYGKSR